MISKDWLLRKQSEVKHVTYDKYEKIVDKHLSYFNDKNMEEITEQEVDEIFYRKEYREHLSKSTLYTISHVLRSLFIYAREEYRLQTITIKNRQHDTKQKQVQILNQ